jgi:hypothetical protein
VTKDAQEDAKAALRLTAERMKQFYDQKTSEIPKYEKGEKVWLSAKNLRIQQPAKKFLAEWVGLYEVIELIGERAVQLKIPRSWSIHDVFHVSLLKPHIPSERHQQPLEPVEIKGEEEHKVSKIKDSRINRRLKKIKYLIE